LLHAAILRRPARLASRERLDSAVAERLGVTRSRARSLILAGLVRVDGQPASKAGALLHDGATVEVEAPPAFVSRGGDKLAFVGVRPVAGRPRRARCRRFDVTDAVLARGARHVTALDVGYGNLRGLLDEVAARIRARIFSGELHDGQRIIERDLAAEMGTSRGPIRDALRILEGEGLVITAPRRGTHVASLTTADALEILAIREAVKRWQSIFTRPQRTQAF